MYVEETRHSLDPFPRAKIHHRMERKMLPCVPIWGPYTLKRCDYHFLQSFSLHNPKLVHAQYGKF